MSQLNPIGDLVVLESVPTISSHRRQQTALDDYAHEKESLDVDESPAEIRGRCLAPNSEHEYREVSWSPQEQKHAVRKIDLFLLPIFMVS